METMWCQSLPRAFIAQQSPDPAWCCEWVSAVMDGQFWLPAEL